LNLPYFRSPFEANLDGRRHSVTTLLQKPLAGAASIVQNTPARSQITIRDDEVKRAEIGHIRRQTSHVDPFQVAENNRPILIKALSERSASFFFSSKLPYLGSRTSPLTSIRAALSLWP
jgi:hypothetical protein